jgi:hypothetical protein
LTVRARLLVAVAFAVALLTVGLSLEMRLGPRALTPPGDAPAETGAWDCPHGGGEGWRAWIALANPGPSPVEIRLTTSSGGAPPSPTVETLDASVLRYIEVAAPLPGSATAVESFGAEIGAGMVIAAPEGGIAAEPCAREAATSWAIAEASTLRGEEARLILHNPFAGEAVLDISLVTGNGSLNPGRLQALLLQPGEARAVDLHHYALGEEALGATVSVTKGRVAVSAVTVSNGGVRASLGVAGPAPRWLLPGIGPRGELLVRAPAPREVAFHAELDGPEGGRRVVDLEAVPAGVVEAFPVSDAIGGIVAEVDGPRTMIVGRRMLPAPAPAPPQDKGGAGGKGGGNDGGKGKSGGKDGGNATAGAGKGGGPGGKGKAQEEEQAPETTDAASTSGTLHEASRWLVLPAVGPDGGEGTLLLQNPAPQPVEIRVRFIGTGGPVGEEQVVTVAAASTAQVGLPDGGPVAALVDAGGGVVAAQAATSTSAFAVAVGVPLS